MVQDSLCKGAFLSSILRAASKFGNNSMVALIKASDLIKLQCFNWEKELQSSKNEGRE